MNQFVFFLIIAGALNGMANLCLAVGNSPTDAKFDPKIYWLCAIFLFGLTFFVYGRSLHGVSISAAYPVLVGISAIIVFLSDLFILGGSVNLIRALGIVLIVSGVFLVRA